MPANRNFSMHITVGDVELPEYEKNGRYYVECPLDTPYTYKHRYVEIRDGETEIQEVPVTPYEIKIWAGNTGSRCFYRVYVDGQHGGNVICDPFEIRNSEGYIKNGYFYEYLFSLPRLTCYQMDRLGANLAPCVGTITVECWEADFDRMVSPSIRNYTQASKADNSQVTGGRYTMTTTRVGRKLPFKRLAQQDYWHLIRVRSRLSVHYRMANDLDIMGFRYQRIPFKTSYNNLMSSENPSRTPEAPTEIISDDNSSDSLEIKDSSVNTNATVPSVCTIGTPKQPIEISSDSESSVSEDITESRMNKNTRPRSNKRPLNAGNNITKRIKPEPGDSAVNLDINGNEQRNSERNLCNVDKSKGTEHARFVKKAAHHFVQAMQKVLQENPIQWNSLIQKNLRFMKWS